MNLASSVRSMSRLDIGHGPGVLLAHGGGGSIAANYSPILDRLSQHHHLIAPDYPGSGLTPRAQAPLQLNALADALVACADDAGLTEFSIVGYSLGTAVAVRAATRHPDRVKDLILTAGIANADTALRTALDVWEALLPGDRDLLARFLLLVSSGTRALNVMDQEDVDQVVSLIADNVPPGTIDHIDLIRRVDTREELRRVRARTLVIATTEDTLVPPHHSAELIRGIPHAKSLDLAAGHNVAGERGDEWAEAILNFLAS